jgi:hypothetical protein
MGRILLFNIKGAPGRDGVDSIVPGPKGAPGRDGRDGSNVLPANTVINDRVFGGKRYDIRDFGAKVDGIVLTDAKTVAGQSNVTSAARAFIAADVGKTIAVMGAGPVIANANDGVWISTILSVSGGTATLTSNATAGGTGLRCVFGTPDDAAYAAAQDAAYAAGGGHVYFPPGRSIATLPLILKDFVSWHGENREVSWVHSIQDRSGSPIVAGECDWMSCAGRTANNPLTGVDVSDFGVEAEAHIHSGGYGTAVKPLNIYYVKRCSITRMHVRNFPATAIPFDHSYDQVSITDNYIYRPGRLAPSGVGPGGSGIGAGTKGTGATEPTLIANNVIIGTQSKTISSPGQNGIFTEAQNGADPDKGVAGYRIVNNVIIGMYYGISDAGSTGTLIDGNTIVKCAVGIAVRKTTLPAAYAGLHTIITDNTIRDGVGPSSTDGIGISITMSSAAAANARRDLHTIIQGNQIIDNQSWGIRVLLPAGGEVDLAGIMIHDNQICRNGRSGIRLGSSGGLKILYPTIKDNQIVANGRAAFGGDTSGVLVAAGTIVEGGRIQDNDIYDLATPKTQLTNVYATGATMTNVLTTGNTSEPAPPAPNSPEFADLGTSAAGTLAGKTIPNGTRSDKTWSVLDTGTGGVFSYTGTAMKATAGTSRVFPHVDLNAEAVASSKWLYGLVKAKVASLAAPPAETFVGLAVNIGTEVGNLSYMYFGPRYNSGAWKYRFGRRTPGASTDGILADLAATPAVGDVIGMSMDGSNVICYLNGVVVATLAWESYHFGRWGMVGAFNTDVSSSLKEWSYNSSIVL